MCTPKVQAIVYCYTHFEPMLVEAVRCAYLVGSLDKYIWGAILVGLHVVAPHTMYTNK